MRRLARWMGSLSVSLSAQRQAPKAISIWHTITTA